MTKSVNLKKALEELNSPKIFKSHKSYALNLDEVDFCESGFVIMNGGAKVLLSRDNKAIFNQLYYGKKNKK